MAQNLYPNDKIGRTTDIVTCSGHLRLPKGLKESCDHVRRECPPQTRVVEQTRPMGGGRGQWGSPPNQRRPPGIWTRSPLWR